MTAQGTAPAFVTCTQCGRSWPGREAFLSDPAVRLSGCQVDTDQPAASALLFDHLASGCGTTMAVSVRAFADLHGGPKGKADWSKSGKCPGFCFDPRSLEPCPTECNSAYVRAVLQAVRSGAGRPKG